MLPNFSMLNSYFWFCPISLSEYLFHVLPNFHIWIPILFVYVFPSSILISNVAEKIILNSCSWFCLIFLSKLQVRRTSHVWQLLRVQHHRPPQHAHCHDVKLLPGGYFLPLAFLMLMLIANANADDAHCHDVKLLPGGTQFHSIYCLPK